MMPELHPVVLEKGGNKLFVVLPYQEYVALKDRLEDLQDLLALEQAIREEADAPTRSLHDVAKDLGLE